MKHITDSLLRDLGFDLETETKNEFELPKNMVSLPMKAFFTGNKALDVHINNLIAEYGLELVVDRLINKMELK